MRSIICSPSISDVLSENFLLRSTNKSSRLFPSKSISITLYLPYVVIAWTWFAENKYFGDAGDGARAGQVLVDFGFEVQLGELCRCFFQLRSVFLLFV